MGYIRDEVVAVVLWDRDDVVKVKAFIAAIPDAPWRELFAVIPAVTSGGATVVMGSDGGNEGRDVSDEGDRIRGEFIALCATLGGRGAHVNFPEDDAGTMVEVPSRYDDREGMTGSGPDGAATEAT